MNMDGEIFDYGVDENQPEIDFDNIGLNEIKCYEAQDILNEKVEDYLKRKKASADDTAVIKDKDNGRFSRDDDDFDR